LRALSLPTLVIHGVDDPLLPIESGADIARAVKGAWLLELNGMGHDLPAELFDLFVGAIGANCARA
jgi:pimeloyl-ACP methyl ester carboxylesterase